MQIEIINSRRKLLLMLAAGSGFVGLAFFLPGPLDHTLIWPGIFLAICVTVIVALLLRPQRLLLDQQGVTVSGGLLRVPIEVQWRDISKFKIVSVFPGVKMIGYVYNKDVNTKSKGTAVNRWVAGVDGGISGVWPGSKAALVERLNTYRERAMRGEDI